MNQVCYLCGSTQNKTVFVENSIPIVKCLNCGHAFSTYEQEEHYEGYWDDEQGYDLEWWDKAHREIYKDFVGKFLKVKSGRILDVGCGLGFFVKTVQTMRPSWEAIGYEISEKAVKFGREKNGLTTIFPGIVQESGLPKESFDIITLWDVIEHIPKPHSLLQYLYGLLKPGGFLFVQTPNFPVQLFKARLKVFLKGMQADGHYLEAKDHINDYTEKTLGLLSTQCGFSSTKFAILKPIASVSGSKAKIGVVLKKGFYYFTLALWYASFKSINLNLTLFALMKK
ncbi:SAM-dependent methyltransferase [Leptospira perolatii]|uniref:SAM-dependent methyltransferase n=1 Tax=Leptospira perolatii TaxID=2023191 RepID=A0A2M9ZR37_9LEPT|nr:class I SAM-dependent methyltransferase [Leptospira perolatii]PJZ71015.1 SAM-dependent methyltransferase [Leptospira perolatii]PJZ74547.1 SAM-dependent methyltransferase [Leptospira perolatii]